MIVYVTEQGAVVRKKGERIVAEKQGVILQEILLIDLHTLVLMGNIQLTTQAASILMSRGIEVMFLTLNGRYKGKLCGSMNRNIFLRMAQYERFNTERVKYARSFVKGKINNQLAVVIQHRWGNSDQRKELKDLAETSFGKIKLAESVEALFGIEGHFANIYFELWGSTLINTDFSQREKHPAYDFVNAALNLAYSFLNNDIICKLDAAGFETSMGFLHSPHYGRASLACDLIEEFRAPVVDRFVKRMINQSHFTAMDFELSNEGCRFKETALKSFIEKYQENYRHFSSIVIRQVYKLKDAVLKDEEYVPWDLRETI